MKKITYILKKGNISPDRKQISETKYNFYTLWKRVKTMYSWRGELAKMDKTEYFCIKTFEEIGDWKDKKSYYGQEIIIDKEK